MSAKTKPSEYAIAISLSDSTNIDFNGKAAATRGLYVGSGGDISVEMIGDGLADATVIFVAVPTGTLLPVSITRVNNTSTTASDLVAIW